MLLQVSLRQRAVFDRLDAGCEGDRAGGRVAFENLCDDRLANRVRPGSPGDRWRHDETAKPLDVQPDIDLSEGRGGGIAWAAGIGGADARGISKASRFRGRAAARDSRRPVRRAARGVLRVSESG